MRKRGFTLIELLVVIGLISLLLALLVPGIQAARRKALRGRCAGNLKTIGAMLSQFAADNMGAWPTRTNISYPFEWDDGFFEQVFAKKYLTEPKVLYCPDNSHDMAPPGRVWKKSWSGSDRQLSYVFLDGMPGPANRAQLAGWERNEVIDNIQHGLRCYRQKRTWQPGPDYPQDPNSGNWGSYTDDFPLRRAGWDSFWRDQNGPVAGDVVLERPDESWIVNHATASGSDPPGMNILYFDGHVSWVSEDTPIKVPGDLPKELTERNKQRLWRRIWTNSNNESIRWLWNPTEATMPNADEKAGLSG